MHEKIEIKDNFREHYKSLLGDRYDEFIKVSMKFLRRSIRINTLKISVDEVKKRLGDKGWILKNVPWCKEGFWIRHKTGRRDVGLTREHSLGYYYIQEAASMIPPVVLDPKPGEIILDMCASPGSKTTQYMGRRGILISNDFKSDRIKSLGINVERMGLTNTIITLMFGQWFGKAGMEFDKVLLDAPCSGTGTIRKSYKTLRIWNATMVKRLSVTQKRLVEIGFKIIKRGGILVYSTCSLEPEENEGVIDHLLKHSDDAEIEEISLDIRRSECITEFNGEMYGPGARKCLRIWPQDNDTEGFFVAKIRKK